jgi:hypothetical protein
MKTIKDRMIFQFEKYFSIEFESSKLNAYQDL